MKPSIYNSPFYVLEISTIDDSNYIIDQVESLSLVKDPDECLNLQNELLNLNTRLKHEVEWLPGVDPTKALSLIESLKLNSPHVFQVSSALAEANLVISHIELSADNLTFTDNVNSIILLANLVDKIKVQELQEIINKDRRLSKFPEITDSNKIELELESRKQAYVEILESFLNTLDPNTLVKIVTLVLEQTTNHGSSYAPNLIYKFIERYNLLTETILDQEVIKINDLVAEIKDKYNKDDSQVEKEITQLINIVTDWDLIAQPSQLAAQSQQIEHKVSKDLAHTLREFGVHLFNINNLSVIPEKINKLISDIFKELPQVYEKAAEDNVQIKKISTDQRKFNRENERAEKEIRESMRYKVEWGVFNIQNLEISDKFIMLNDIMLLWDNITGFKIDGMRDQNAAQAVTSLISLGLVNLSDLRLKFSFTTKSISDTATTQLYIDAKGNVCDEIYSRLSLLRNRLISETRIALENGGKIKIGNMQYDNYGFYFSKTYFVKATYLTWEDISRAKEWNEGTWFIQSKDGGLLKKRPKATFTMGADYNIDIFYHLLETAWNYGGSITESYKQALINQNKE